MTSRPRVVSLVPSLTEALSTSPDVALVGVTDWCTHPTDVEARGAVRVRGTKNPDLAAIRGLAPDLVVCAKEENRELDVRRLGEADVPVVVYDIDSVPSAVTAFRDLFTRLGVTTPDWVEQVEHLWCGPPPEVTQDVAVMIWRDPWMCVGGDTFTSDLIRRLGWRNVYADLGRYPSVTPSQVESRGPDVVLLPDEPYRFTAADGPEAFDVPTRLIDGRLLTWYGPSLIAAHRLAGG